MVERVVSDIDEIVRHVRFEGWQTIHAGEREVKKALRKTLFKYHLHHDMELFDRAYGYTFGSTTEALERDRPVTAKPRPVQVRVALAQLGGHSWAGPRGHAPVSHRCSSQRATASSSLEPMMAVACSASSGAAPATAYASSAVRNMPMSLT